MSKSNLNGRSLEFFIINEILNSFKNINISNQLNDKLIIDKNNLIHLDERLYARFKTASKKIIPFIDNIIGKSSVINLERLSDIEGVKGDITDIRISYDKKILNLSLKHNLPKKLCLLIKFLRSSAFHMLFSNSLNFF